MILTLLLACPNPDAAKDSGAAEAWPGWAEEAEDSAADPTASADDSAEEELDIEYPECEPDGCIELAEAVDRSFATIGYGYAGIVVDNLGPYPICFERWYTFLSSESQDAVAGTTSDTEIPVGESLHVPYAEWGDDQEAWWCIEHNQYTASGAAYSFNGARAPTRVSQWTNDASDEDSDSAEDHDDYSLSDGLPQTQHNVWDYIADRPVFIVGRDMNWFEVEGRQSVEVVLKVHNLGREDGTAQVLEKLPPGWTASDLSPAPLRNEVGGDGSTQLAWSVELEAAVEPSDPYAPTEYDIAKLRYTLTYAGTCSGREIGYMPNVSWQDGTGSAWISEGSPLVIECCDSDDGPLPGGGGHGP